MGHRRIRVVLAGALAVALLAGSVLPAVAAPRKAGATLFVCVQSSGEFVETLTWSHINVDGVEWFMDGGENGSGGVAVPVTRANSGTLLSGGPAGIDWNVNALSVRASLSFHDRTMWSQQVDQPAGGWSVCP